MRNTIVATILCLVSLAAAPAGLPVYAVIGGGYTQLKLQDDLPYAAKEEHKPMWTAGVGVKANDYFRMEASYYDLGHYSNTEHSHFVGSLGGPPIVIDEHGTGTGHLTGVGFSVVLSAASKVTPFLRLGEFLDLSKVSDIRAQTGTTPITMNVATSDHTLKPMGGVGLAVGNITVEYDLVHDVGLWQKANVGWGQVSYRVTF
jgi:hypothetical protein